MKLSRWTGPLALAALTSFSAAPPRALDAGPFDVEVLVGGRPLSEYTARGTSYVEAHHEYSVRLSNRTPGRIAVALAVDGLNSIDAKTTPAGEAAKWILAPYQTITIDGWQVNSSDARRFFFTTEDRSYGAWLGRTKNLGVISAAFFRERQPQPVPLVEPGCDRDGAAQEGRAAPRASALPPASEEKARRQDALSDDMAATGIGRRVDHSVRRVEFEAESAPAAVVEVRYEYHEALVRLGVLPQPPVWREDPLSRREAAHGFTDHDFAPDPYRDR